MSENKRLTPICIIYIDGIRMNPVCEGAFCSVMVSDSLNNVSECRIRFNLAGLTEADIRNFAFESRVSIHLGYKDNINEVFDGEITEIHNRYGTNSHTVFEVVVSSCLHRLNHGQRSRSFEKKTPSQAIKEILSIYNLRAECDDFGREFPFWSCGETDLVHIMMLASKYGKDIHAVGDKVYVKSQMRHRPDEIIYEWGKSLIAFNAEVNTLGQAKEINVIGWDIRKGESIIGSAKAGDVELKVGGEKDWTKVSRSGDKGRIETIVERSVTGAAEARELAIAKMRERSFKFITARGRGEGNNKLFPGMLVTVKYTGPFSGEYIADRVIHDFNVSSGYTTEFYLKRNMVGEEFKKSGPKPMSIQSGGAAGRNDTAASQIDDVYKDDKKDEPEFRGLKWLKGGKETGEALVDDEVKLVCEVKNIDEGARVKLKIFERGESKDDPIDEVAGTVKDGKIEATWKVVYKENDNCRQEIEEQGYTVPDYYFTVEYNGVESEQSKMLDVKAWGYEQIIYGDTREHLINHNYILLTPEGDFISGCSDANGFIDTNGKKIGEHMVIAHLDHE